MKKFTIALVSLFATSILFGQTDSQKAVIIEGYNLETLTQLSIRLQNEYNQEYARALELARINGWEIKIIKEDGTILELDGVFDDGTPIYVSTENESAARTTRTDKLQPGGDTGLDLTGTNMTLGLWEVDATRPSHELFEGRVTQVNPDSQSDHANHVAGTILGGDGIQVGARGMAWDARIRAFNSSNDESEMASEASNGMLISSHSYGIPAGGTSAYYRGKYDNNAKDVDEVMYNAPYYLAVFSAGNDRNDGINSTGYDLLTDKSCNKNGLTVAAVSTVNFYNGPNSVNMSNFSSWGPTDDGRIKPDISAKGVSTFSASAQDNSDYYTASGTSMATPNVSGTLLLLQEHYYNVNGEFMLSSTLRGLACHTASEAGDADGPDYEYGWGLLDAEYAANVISNNGGESLISELILNSGESYSIQVYAADSVDLHASITWTDPEGTVGPNITDDRTPILVNDLDLRITKDSLEYFPWILDVENPSDPATTGDNVVDNIEKVQVDSSYGLYTITVTHKGVLLYPQAFSLIITGIGDCTGEPGGTAFIDSCGTCVGGTSGLTACPPDCNGVYGGTAYIDSCGYCADGNTGFTPILSDEICGNHEIGVTSDILEIFPNPASEELNLHFTDSIPAQCEIRIYASDGKLIYDVLNPIDPQLTINLAGIRSGVYVVKLTSPDHNLVERIVIEN